MRLNLKSQIVRNILALGTRLGDKVIDAVPTVSRDDLKFLGSRDGGKTIPMDLVTSETICYSGGVGEDTTFDESLIRESGCHVWAFDPTPRAIGHAAQVGLPEFHFRPWGLAGRDGPRRLYAPANPSHVSHSIVNLSGTREWFEAGCYRLSTVMEKLNHVEIGVLKLDIEGAEYEVLSDMLKSKLRPRVLCLEFDQPAPRRRTISMIARLYLAGYRRVSRRWWDFTFVRY